MFYDKYVVRQFFNQVVFQPLIEFKIYIACVVVWVISCGYVRCCSCPFVVYENTKNFDIWTSMLFKDMHCHQ